MKTAVVVGAIAITLLSSRTTRAFCRTTTCDQVATCEVDEAGCTKDGFPLFWRAGRTLRFRFHRQGAALLVAEEARAAIRAAFFRWTDVECPGGRTSLRFVEGEELVDDLQASRVPADHSGIYFRDRGWPYQSSGGDGEVALTTVTFRKDSGLILYADIEINSSNQRFATDEKSDGIDLQTVVTHEVGHFVGLAHSAVANSIMAPSLCESGDRCSISRVASRRLGDDDRAGLCALYPPGDGTPPASSDSESAGCSVVSAGQGDGRGLAALLWVCVGVLVVVVRRQTSI